MVLYKRGFVFDLFGVMSRIGDDDGSGGGGGGGGIL